MQLLSTTAIFATLLFSTLSLAQPPPAPETGSPGNTTGALGDAKTYVENPTGKSYVADFQGTKLNGKITFSPQPDSKGVRVEVSLTNFPSEGGPFGYHIHDQPVPADGNCTGTKAHLDPFIRGQKVPCDPKKPATCEVGDLAGKHGTILANPGNPTFAQTYVENYITLNQGLGAFIGNRSIVVHTADMKRYACANIAASDKQTAPPVTGGGSSFRNTGYLVYTLVAAVGLRCLLV